MSEQSEQDGTRHLEEQATSSVHPAHADRNGTQSGEVSPRTPLPIAAILALMSPCAPTSPDTKPNADLDADPNVAPAYRQLAAQVGCATRRWRIARALTRQSLAARLALSLDQLLCLEHNLLPPTALPLAALDALARDLGASEADQALAAAIADYLALARP